MELIRLIYASGARPDIGYDALTDILVSAGEFNRANDITGMLCYSNDAFLQALEGRRSVVSRLYHRIAADARHSDPQLLSCTVIEERAFSGWSMRLVSWDDRFTARRRAEVMRECGLAALDPDQLTSEKAFAFLQVLAALERRPECQAVA